MRKQEKFIMALKDIAKKRKEKTRELAKVLIELEDLRVEEVTETVKHQLVLSNTVVLRPNGIKFHRLGG